MSIFKKYSNTLSYPIIFSLLLSIIFTPLLGVLMGTGIGVAVGHYEDSKQKYL